MSHIRPAAVTRQGKENTDMKPTFRSRSLLLVALALSLATTVRAQVSNSHRIAMYSLPAVVSIHDGYTGHIRWKETGEVVTESTHSSGSGFFVEPDGYIVTNAHVVKSTHEGIDAGKDELLAMLAQEVAAQHGAAKRVEDILKDTLVMDRLRKATEFVSVEAFNLVIMSDGSTLPYEIKAYGGAKEDAGVKKDVAVIKIETHNAPCLPLGNSDAIDLLDKVLVIGFPSAAYNPGVLDEKSGQIASVTDGTISARKSLTNGVPVLQVSAAATHGNSGGPVINENGEVVGLLTFSIAVPNQRNGAPEEIAGFHFVVASNTVKEFVRQAGIDAAQGSTDRIYRQGLDLMWRGQFEAAAAKFGMVCRLYPHHEQAQDLILRCTDQADGQAGGDTHSSHGATQDGSVTPDAKSANSKSHAAHSKP